MQAWEQSFHIYNILQISNLSIKSQICYLDVWNMIYDAKLYTPRDHISDELFYGAQY
jgi:hypothetical protein